MHHRVLAAAAVLAFAVGARRAAAEEPRATGSARVLRVKQLFERLFYDDAMRVCRAALDAGRNSRGDLVKLFGYQGLIAASLGREAAAIDAFKRVLAIDPRAKLARGYAPRVRRAFDAALRFMQERAALEVAVSAPEEVDRDGELALGLAVKSDPLAMVERAVLFLRAAGAPDAGFTPLPTDRGRSLAWRVKLGSLPGIAAAPALEYYLAVLDRDFSELVLVGSAQAPRRIRIRALARATPPVPVAVVISPRDPERDRQAPVYKRWWFWTAIGAAVATAVGVGVGFGARTPRETVSAPISLETGK
jgi:tetratricopeptide (TPR) repeat protein